MSEKETACLRDITETDIMEYMQVEHPHNEKELWKMKYATPARIGIGRCGARYTTEAQLRFLAAHAAANDAVFNEVPEEVVKELGVFEVRTRCANKNEMLLRPDWGREFLPDARQKIVENCVHHPQVQIYFGDGCARRLSGRTFRICFPTIKMGLEDKGITVGDAVFRAVLQSEYRADDRTAPGCGGDLRAHRRAPGSSDVREHVGIYRLPCETGHA